MPADDSKIMKLESPITVTQLEIDKSALWPALQPSRSADQGSWVKVRLADGGKDTRTHLGILLGDLPVGISLGVKNGETEEEKTLHIIAGMANPCMFVPALNRLVFGMESWWGEISSAEDLQEITDQDIENVWYVRALRDLEGRRQKLDA